MVRKYIRKTNKNGWIDGQMQLAINSVLEGKSIKSAAIEFDVPRSTLQRKLRNSNETSHEPSQCGSKRTFTDEQEQALSTYITDMQGKLMGFKSLEIRRLAFDFAERLKIPHKFNQSKRLAGKDWMQKFMDRHGLSYRKTEHTSTARANGFNKVEVQKFFDLLEKCITTYKIKDEDIYNVDESGVSVNPKSTSKIVAKKGLKQVGGLTASERGETVTAELCMSADGKFMPPMLIFPRVNRNEEFLAEAPAGAWGEFHKSGWIQSELFTKWLKQFIKFSQASKDKPVLLLLDGHSSHIKNLDVVNLANENGIILCFPPHCTHRMQPLDVGFMKPLSHFYSEIVMELQRLGHKVTMKDIFKLFGKAWQRAAKIETAVNSFKKTGIWPFNRHIFKDSDYAVLRREPSLNEIVTIPQVQENINIIQEIHQNSSALNECNSTTSSFQSLNETSNKEQILIPIDKIKEAQSLIQSLNSIFTNMTNSFSDSTEKFTVPDPFEMLHSTPSTSQDLSQECSSRPNNSPSQKSITKTVNRSKDQAAIITDEAYKENLIAQKIKNIKKEPKENKETKRKPKENKETKRRGKPTIVSDVLVTKSIKVPVKRKADSVPQVQTKKVLTESQNFQRQELSFTQDGNSYQVINNNEYSAIINNNEHPILYQLDLNASNGLNIYSAETAVPQEVINPILIEISGDSNVFKNVIIKIKNRFNSL